jgi:hypothetical protein
MKFCWVPGVDAVNRIEVPPSPSRENWYLPGKSTLRESRPNTRGAPRWPAYSGDVGDLRRRGAPLNNGYAQIAERRIPAVSRVSLESIAFETGCPSPEMCPPTRRYAATRS